HHPAFLDVEARAGDDLHLREAGAIQRLAQQPDRRRRDTGANEMPQLCLAAILPDRFGRMTLENRVRALQIEPLGVAPAMRVEAEGKAARCHELGKAPTNLERVADLAAEIIAEHRH